MFKLRYFVLIVTITVGGAVAFNFYAQREQPEGDQSYTPTKLEWLALLLNVNQKDDGEIQTTYRPHREKKNTIAALVVHSPQAKESLVKANVTIAKRSVIRITRQYGWDWVIVEVQVAEFNTGFVE